MHKSKGGSLEAAVAKHLRNFTVTVTTLQILEAHIRASESRSPPVGLSLREIGKGYNAVAESVGKPTFFGTYVQRHAKSGDLFQETDGRYRLRDELVQGLKIAQIVRLRDHILSHLKQLQERKREVDAQFREFYELAISDVDSRRDFIERKLLASDGNAGQNFEIMSFAILCVYFRIFGFSLRRFSTTFSNDGGMDFIAGDGIYQVTANATELKVASDLAKLPGTRRVVVARSIRNRAAIEGAESVLGVIDIKDLVAQFLEWLTTVDKRRGTAVLLQEVVKVARDEFNRD